MALQIAALIVIVVAVGYAWRSLLCQHVDVDGRSLLRWERSGANLHGRCNLCHRRTSGWVNVPRI